MIGPSRPRAAARHGGRPQPALVRPGDGVSDGLLPPPT